ncbi:uncharacterized protein LOC144170825 [Haemaphysalis longicornis]
MAVASACLAIGLLSHLKAATARSPPPPPSTISPMFMDCPEMDFVERCRNTLLASTELNGVKLDLSNPNEVENYETCMLDKLELTLRETVFWCENKGSLARKIALCYEYVLRMQAPEIPDQVIVEKIDEFQVCLEKVEMPRADRRAYAAMKSHKRRRVAHRVPTSEQGNLNKYRRHNGNAHSLNHFYPRLEHGLGNETSANQTKPTRDETTGGVTKPQGSPTKPQGSPTKPQGGPTKLQGGLTKPQGGLTKPQGGLTKPQTPTNKTNGGR